MPVRPSFPASFHASEVRRLALTVADVPAGAEVINVEIDAPEGLAIRETGRDVGGEGPATTVAFWLDPSEPGKHTAALRATTDQGEVLLRAFVVTITEDPSPTTS